LTIFLQNILHGWCNLCIALNEILVVYSMSQRSAQLSNWSGGGGRSTIIAILDRSISNPCLQTIWPSSTPKGENNMHFFRFREIWHCLHLSNISLKNSIWFFNNLKIIKNISVVGVFMIGQNSHSLVNRVSTFQIQIRIHLQDNEPGFR